MRVQFCIYVATCLFILHGDSSWAHDVDDDEDNESVKTSKAKLSNAKKQSKSKDNVLLISFDSFGWKYLDLVTTPVLDTFKKYGVYADYILNVIPTETFPNHVSIATGLWPESHGIISNDMYDPVFKDRFDMSVTDPKWWWHSGVEPIWYTNEKQGGISGITWWPGYNIKGYTATHSNNQKWDALSYVQLVDLSLQWMKSDKPPNFLMLYFGQLDHEGHLHGFGSHQSIEQVKNNDNITGYLIEQLKKNNLLDKWNIILTADHGMTNISRSRSINVTDYVDPSDCILINGDGGVHFVWPKENKTKEVYKKLKKTHHPNMQVYLKEDFPENYHYRNNRRVSPIIITCDEGWTLINDPKTWVWRHPKHGSHGYLTDVPRMWPIFMARGPAFKSGYHSNHFNSVDLYPLICKLLKIKPNPNNGSYSAVEPLLTGSKGSASMSPILIGVMVSSIFFALGILICGVTVCLSDRKAKKFRTNRAWNNNMKMSQLEQSDKLLLSEDDDEETEEFLASTKSGTV